MKNQLKVKATKKVNFNSYLLLLQVLTSGPGKR